jgi:lysozyme family protein
MPTKTADFIAAFSRTQRWEGGGVVHTVPGDPGGTTKWGISAKAYPDLDIAGLTILQAMEIAHQHYWVPVGCDELPAPLRWDVFDMAFNAGKIPAVRCLQDALNLCIANKGGQDYLETDGVPGPLTLAAAQEYDPYDIRRLFRAYRQEHYLILAETGWAKFIHGWLKRANNEIGEPR